MKNFPVRCIVGMGLLAIGAHTANAQWKSTNSPGAVYSLAVKGDTVFTGTLTGVSLSVIGSASWSSASSGITSYYVWTLAVSGGTIFAGTDGGVYLSANDGASWKAASSGLPKGSDTVVTALLVSGGDIFAGTASGVYLSTNNGTSWTAANSGITSDTVRSLLASGGDIFAGTTGGVYLSTNNGTSWKAVNSGLGNLYVWSLAASGDTIFAGTNGGIYSSANNGTSWTGSSSGLTSDTVYSLFVTRKNIFAGTYLSGVFLSTNSGATWKADNSGLLPIVDVFAFAVSGTTMFAGCNNGVYSASLASLGAGVRYNPQRAALNNENLLISSPSRANPDATIAFTLSHSDKVTVGVYNLSGHEIASLIDDYLGQGAHSIMWNTNNLAAGCYTVRLQAGSNTRVTSVPIFR
jgi:hypothetical protein